MWRAGATPASGHERMFKTLWFDDNLNGKIKKDATSSDQSAPGSDTGDVCFGTAAAAQVTLHDLYDQNSQATTTSTKIWERLTDSTTATWSEK